MSAGGAFFIAVIVLVPTFVGALMFALGRSDCGQASGE